MPDGVFSRTDAPVREPPESLPQEDAAAPAPDGSRADAPGSFGADSGEDSAPEEAHVPPEGDEALPPLPADPDLIALRRLIFQRELLLLEQINARLSDPGLYSRDVSAVVAEAILLRSRKDDKLERVLEPLVGSILGHSLHKKRSAFADVLFPVMGPAIRRSIAETFRSMLDGFNKSVEMSLSWRGLRWRLEAWRTGKPFSEVVLLHTLLYRVEQIFLIHGDTGLVLCHVVGEGVESQDADMVSAMLTAIQDFVRDCFAGGGEAGALEQLQLGDFTILVEKHPLAYLACVVRGTPPVQLRERLRSSLDLILVEHAETLRAYSGDNEPFLAVRRLLDDCLESRFVEERVISPIWIRALWALLLLLAVGGGGAWAYMWRLDGLERAETEKRLQEQRSFREAFVEILRKEPGILLINVTRPDDLPWEITCLRDLLARPIDRIIHEIGGRPSDFTVIETLYDSFDPEIVALRVKRELHPPEGVDMRYTGDGVLTFSGAAPLPWIMQIKQTARSVPGVKTVVTKDLKDPRLDALQAMARRVESSVVEFPLGKDLPVPADLQKLKDIVNTLTEIEHLADEMGIVVNLAVYGYADAVGNDKRNFELSQARARTLAAMLHAKGSKMPLSVHGMPVEYYQQFGQSPSGAFTDRRLELRIILTLPDVDVFELLKTD
jgi:OOP family OmpA-OmpF porin